MSNTLPENIIPKEANVSTIDGIGHVVLQTKNNLLFSKTINTIINYLKSYTPPVAEISQEQINAAILANRKEYTISVSQDNGATVELDDGTSITRDNLRFVISHSVATRNLFVKVAELDGSLVSNCDVRCTSNQIIVEFITLPENDLSLFVM